MEWNNRGDRPSQPVNATAGHPAAASHGHGHKAKEREGVVNTIIKITSVILLFSATILSIALLFYLFIGGTNEKQSKFVQNDKMQAVFLNGGQVYFGDIKTLNSSYMRLTNIYYLRVNQQVQPNQTNTQQNNDISLVKLGCELHGPVDEMLINSDQVTFWENLKNDGQVAKAVEEYVKANPNGQKCEQTNATTTTPPAATTPAPTTPTTPVPTTNRTNTNNR